MSKFHGLRHPVTIIIALLFLCLTPFIGTAEQPALSPKVKADVNSMMAGLSDEQVRSLLIEELQKDALNNTNTTVKSAGPDGVLQEMLDGLEHVSTSSDDQTQALFEKIPNVLPDIYTIFVRLCPHQTIKGAIGNLAGILFFILIGLFIEKSARKIILPKFVKAESLGNIFTPIHNFEKITASLVLELPSIIGLFLFFAAAYFCYMFFIWTDIAYLRIVFLATLISVTLIRAITIFSRILFSPRSPTLRIMPMECHIAGTIHRLVTWTAGYAVIGLMFIVVSKKLGAMPETVTLLQLFIASLLLLISAGLILLLKNKVKEQILVPSAAGDDKPSWGRQQFASIWHIPALLYLGCLWILLFTNLINPTEHTRGAFLLSFFILPIWIVADMALQWIVRYSMATLKIYSDSLDEGEEISEEELDNRDKGRKTYHRVLLISRIFLVLGLIVWVASLWNIQIPVFSRLSAVIFDALVIMTLAMLFWKFISNWIERKIEESIPKEDPDKEESDDEWGSAAARGRSYTLLPMLRRFIGTILMTMVTLTLLSSMGVDIGPLLAGAGVIGLAVGFGAQKLVADMFSGFFYLLDDAFRVGEYIEAGGIMGTVENISLRNVMLRHHRGMLQIVPHSELGSITNYMRGGIVVKFNLDFPYDADIDQIRKIIKKVGIAMLEDEELGGDFIKQVKSQGVREITNSVMTIRVKFTAKAGAHFVIRREAYRRITEALRAKGIEYAHKKVIVDIPTPPPGAPAPTQEQLIQAAGAAAQQVVEEEQANKNQQTGKSQPSGAFD
ncbi:mechanosensitive ion channel domain-containing protein [Desulfopila sp. IMCC35008]|uniref:mechanosensitive ion channel domain-containing protein n=1 Tax=Desulfopila sp. IMCC35008 TaxID=2653858 RepID=UPI0013D619B2|nr:mechanosensitive ion channel domain-containing protein [Desulfopila sp. IMCC35008]